MTLRAMSQIFSKSVRVTVLVSAVSVSGLAHAGDQNPLPAPLPSQAGQGSTCFCVQSTEQFPQVQLVYTSALGVTDVVERWLAYGDFPLAETKCATAIEQLQLFGECTNRSVTQAQ